MLKRFYSYFIFLFLTSPFIQAEELSISISDDVDLTVEQYSAKGDYLALWLAPEYGLRPNHRAFAKALSKKGVEVWQTDILESLFIPHDTFALKNIDTAHIAKLIEIAHQQTKKKIILIADSYAAINALRSAHLWQNEVQGKKPKNSQNISTSKSPYLIGAILFSPYVYSSIPALGLTPELVPIVSSTNIPIMIYQANKSGNITQFNLLTKLLQQHNNPIYTKFIADLRSLFYTSNPTKNQKQTIAKLAPHVKKMIKQLNRHEFPLTTIPLKKREDSKTFVDSQLKKFKGKLLAQPINLLDAHNNSYTKESYKGQITLVNFWATWCPPCVEEIPSLNRLKQKMKDVPFEIVSVNYAEDNKTIIDFMKKVKVDFPVLLDHNGKYAKQWNVIAYPSTFVIGPKGKIIYGVNAAIEWDDDKVIQQFRNLF